MSRKSSGAGVPPLDSVFGLVMRSQTNDKSSFETLRNNLADQFLTATQKHRIGMGIATKKYNQC